MCKYIPKNTNFGEGAVGPHLLRHNGEIWREGMDVGHPPVHLIL